MDLTQVISKLEKLPARMQMSAARTIANNMRRYMHEYGMTPDGVTYAPYTKAYARRRFNKFGLQVDKVDLKVTGEYGRGIKPRKEGEDIIVAPKDSDLPRAQGLSKKRPHIGVAPEVPGLIEASWQGLFESL